MACVVSIISGADECTGGRMRGAATKIQRDISGESTSKQLRSESFCRALAHRAQVLSLFVITQYCCLQHCIFIKLCDSATIFNTGSFELVHISSRELWWLHIHYWSALLFFLHGCINLYWLWSNNCYPRSRIKWAISLIVPIPQTINRASSCSCFIYRGQVYIVKALFVLFTPHKIILNY